MNNRVAFIDFVHGLLNLNPLERWTPQQARTHPFITQQKFTGPFQPQMHLKSSTRSPAPGVTAQQQAEALSRQRAQAAQQQQAQQAQSAANAAYANLQIHTPAYPTSPHAQQPPQNIMYGNVYSPSHQAVPPPYPSNPPSAYSQPQQVPILQQPPPAAAAIHGHHPHAYQHNQASQQLQQQQQQQSSLYAQATTRAGRQRASTMDMSNGIPPALQRVVSHLDPNAPIRLQPSPAYYPPPSEGQQGDIGNVGGRRRMSRGPRDARSGQASGTNFVRQLEDRTLEEGWTGGGGNSGWA